MESANHSAWQFLTYFSGTPWNHHPCHQSLAALKLSYLCIGLLVSCLPSLELSFLRARALSVFAPHCISSVHSRQSTSGCWKHEMWKHAAMAPAQLKSITNPRPSQDPLSSTAWESHTEMETHEERQQLNILPRAKVSMFQCPQKTLSLIEELKRQLSIKDRSEFWPIYQLNIISFQNNMLKEWPGRNTTSWSLEILEDFWDDG